MPLPQISSALIFDFGDVLFSWSSKKTSSSIAPRTLKAILSSPSWQDFERAHISQHDCYERIGCEFSVSPSQVKLAFDDARNSLRSNDEMISFLRQLKSESKGQLKVYAMSNISHSDYEFLKSIPTDWSLFDKVYTSADAGERKPNLGFYRHVLADIGTEPQAVVFVDDKPENVLSARSFGMTGIVFDDQKRVMRAVRNAVQDPIERGRKFLQGHAGCLDSVTNNGIILKENFTQLLILEATGDSNLVRLIEHDRAWNFFQGTPVLTTEEFPCDLDTTSLALTVTRQSTNVISSVMDEMLEYLDKDGIVQTYFDHKRQRFDPVVCVNVLTLFYSNGRGHQLPQTFEWVREVLINRGYTDGTRYYSTGDCFLFFLARLLEQLKGTKADAQIRPFLQERIQERIGSEGDALALAMRVLTCASVGIRDETDLRALLNYQCEDGGWENGWIYKYGSSGISIGNRGLVTALAINAIAAVQNMPAPVPSSSTPRRSSFGIAGPKNVIGNSISRKFTATPPDDRSTNSNKSHRRSNSLGEVSSLARKHFHWPWFRAPPQ